LVVLGLISVPALAGEVDAVVQWSGRVELSLPVSGVIEQVNVNAGERVTKDQVLLALDATPFGNALRAAEARAARAKSERDEAARDAKQAKELYDRTVLSTVDLDNARMKHARAEAAYQEARAALDQAAYRLKVSAVRAPYDAWVLKREAQPGQTVSADIKPPTLLVLASAVEYLAVLRLPPERLANLKVGQAVEVSVAGKKYPGQIRSIGLESGKDHALEVAFAADDALRAGQAARVNLP
jgi:RND family efflux transporter MFP subunit